MHSTAAGAVAASRGRAAAPAGPRGRGPGAGDGLMDEPQLTTESWPQSYDGQAQERMGFFTDTTVCIGCKACEVACKEWNLLPDGGFIFTANSYDNTGALGSETWRHVAFIEQDVPLFEGEED